MDAPFAGSLSEGRTIQNTGEMLRNMYATIEADGGKSKIVRVQRPGIEAVFPHTGTKRGIQAFDGVTYAVCGGDVYRITTGAPELYGTIDNGSSRVTFAANQTQIAICDGSNLWLSVSGGAFTKIATDAFIGAASIAQLDSRLIIGEADSDRFFVSAPNDFAAITALDFASAESAPDKIVRVFVDHREIWLFGTSTIEVWNNQGGESFPFARFGGAAFEIGCYAGATIAAADNTVFWLGDDKIIYRAEGYQPKRVSTEPVELLLSEVDASGAYGFFYATSGHKFYVLTVPGSFSVAYDTATGAWHKLQTFGFDEWRAFGSQARPNSYILTDSGISRLVEGLATDEGGILERGGRSPPIHSGQKRFIVDAYSIDCEAGRGSLGSDPQIMIRVSRDGETFGNELWRGLGRIGEYARRAVWRRLGIAREMHVEFSVTDPVPLKIIGASMQARVLGDRQ